jgi:hypothetical protein
VDVAAVKEQLFVAQRQIEALEADIRKKDAEIERLKEIEWMYSDLRR